MKLEIVLSEKSLTTLNTIVKTKEDLTPISIDEAIESIISIYGNRYLNLLKSARKIALREEKRSRND